jgi:hypothetical protein
MLPLTALLFHENYYRIVKSDNGSLLPITRAYLEDVSAHAYALIFEGYYEISPLDGVSDCITAAIVTRDGNARTEHIPFIRDGKNVTILEKRLALMDEPFLHLFEPLPSGKYDPKAIKKALKSVMEITKKPYSDFIVASIGI